MDCADSNSPSFSKVRPYWSRNIERTWIGELFSNKFIALRNIAFTKRKIILKDWKFKLKLLWLQWNDQLKQNYKRLNKSQLDPMWLTPWIKNMHQFMKRANYYQAFGQSRSSDNSIKTKRMSRDRQTALNANTAAIKAISTISLRRECKPSSDCRRLQF